MIVLIENRSVNRRIRINDREPWKIKLKSLYMHNFIFVFYVDTLFKGLTEPAPTQSKTIYLVDGGLTFNLPFPLLLRPEREVDLYLAFDFSSREADNSAPFKVIFLVFLMFCFNIYCNNY